MTLSQSKLRRSAFNIIELLVLIGISGLFVAVAVPALLEARDKSRQIDCTDNLRQIGVGFKLWSENAWDFPMALSTNYGGTRENANEVWRTFQVMSNELNRPGVLWCPVDARGSASSWAELANSNISYFVGLDADVAAPNALLSGDRHLGIGTRPQNQVIKLRTNDVLRWTTAPHVRGGNILFGDGSVRTLDDPQLQGRVAGIWKDDTGHLQNGTIRIAIPE